MAVFTSLEQVRAVRSKRRAVFEKAREMRESGRISEAEFSVLERKYAEKMAVLDRAEREFMARQSAPPSAASEAPPPAQPTARDEVLGLARNILGGPGEAAGAPPTPPPPPPPPTPILDFFADSSKPGDRSPGATLDLDDTPPMDDAPGFVGEFTSSSTTDPGPPAARPRPAGDADLLSLVRGSFGAGSGGDGKAERELHSEGVARRHAETVAKEKEKEAQEMHEAFRRAVDEKDRMGEKLLATRTRSRKQQQLLQGAGAAAIVLGGAAMFLFLRSSTQSQEVADLKRQIQEFRVQAIDLQGRFDKVDGDSRKLAELARGLKSKSEGLETRLEEATTRAAELQEELDNRPAVTAFDEQEFHPDARAEAGLQRLLALRVERSGSSREVFLDEARGEIADLESLLSELAGRLQNQPSPFDRALEQLLEGQLPQAAASLRTALEARGQRYRQLRNLTARLLLETGDAGGAAAFLEGIQGQDSDTQDGRRTLVAAYRKLRRYQDARRVLGEVLRSSSVTTDDYLQAGILADMAEDRKGAEQAYQQVLQRDPTNPRAITLLSSLAIERQDWQQARSYLEKAVARNPEDPGLKYNLAVTFLGLGEVELARPLVTDLVARQWPGAAELQAQLGGGTPEPFEPEEDPEDPFLSG